MLNNIFYKLRRKGVGLVEYAVLLAFVTTVSAIFAPPDYAIGFSIAKAVVRMNNTLDGRKSVTAPDMDKIAAAVKGFIGNLGSYKVGNEEKINPGRGMIRDGWTNNEGVGLDEALRDSLAEAGINLDDLNATTWVLYDSNFKNTVPKEASGFYWTDNSLSSTVKNSKGYSNDTVDYYFYSTNDKKFYAVNGYYWPNQSELGGAGHGTLAHWGQEADKPVATKSGPYDTLDDLKAAMLLK